MDAINRADLEREVRRLCQEGAIVAATASTIRAYGHEILGFLIAQHRSGADADEVFSLCQHDWSSIRADPEMRATEAIIRHAQDRGLRIVTYLDYYQERLAERAATQDVAAAAD